MTEETNEEYGTRKKEVDININVSQEGNKTEIKKQASKTLHMPARLLGFGWINPLSGSNNLS